MTNVGKYQILEELGIGSMGTVYRARDTVLDREVALKTIRAGPSIEAEIKERFYREARACARLQHPHIVTIHDFGEVDNTAYISMELLIGEDLRRIIEKKRKIPLHAKIEIIKQVSEALAHAHQNEVIHRDIKPSNIFVLSDNSAKVLDFGIARLSASRLTVAGRVLGTPNYMAPEQIQGNICDSRSDLFSLAIVFFEFLGGAHPFNGPLIPRRIVESAPDKLVLPETTVPPSLERVLEKALQKQPENRFQTADEFSAALRELIDELEGRVVAEASERVAAAEKPPEPVETAPPPAQSGSQTQILESADQRASEFFRLMEECDRAMESKRLNEAREALRKMQKLAAIDARFGTAVQEYENQVQSIADRSSRGGGSTTDLPKAPSPAPPVISQAPLKGGESSAGGGAGSVGSGSASVGSGSASVGTGSASIGRSGPPAGSGGTSPGSGRGTAGSSGASLESSRASAGSGGAPESRPTPPASAGDVTRLFSMRDVNAAATTTAQESGSFDLRVSEPSQAPAPSESGTKCASCGAQNKPDSRFCVICGVELGKSSGRTADQIPLAEEQPIARVESHAPAPSTAKPLQRSTPVDNRQLYVRLAIGLGVAAVILIGFLTFRLVSSRRVAVVPAVGTAVVTSETADVLASPSSHERRLAQLRKGARLNIVRMPQSQNPEWLAVQQLDGTRARAPGYIRSSALGQWSTFQLARLFDPGEPADPQRRVAYLQLLHSAAAEFKNPEDQNNAWLEIARLNAAAAKDQKAASPGSDEWRSYLAEARNALSKISSDASAAQQANLIEQQIVSLLEAPPPANSPAPATPTAAEPPAAAPVEPLPAPVRRAYDAQADYKSAQEAFRTGQYARATRLLERILAADNKNQEARNLLQRVRKAAAEEAAASGNHP